MFSGRRAVHSPIAHVRMYGNPRLPVCLDSAPPLSRLIIGLLLAQGRIRTTETTSTECAFQYSKPTSFSPSPNPANRLPCLPMVSR